MNQAQKKPTLQGNDILFECRECGKSLAIDCRGAGLKIHCPQCDTDLEVPIPEGFDLSQLDKAIASSELLFGEAQIGAPAPAQAVSAETDDQLRALHAELQALRAEKQLFVQQQAELLEASGKIIRQLEEFRQTLEKLGRGGVSAGAQGAPAQKPH